ncbi:hypothetical protein QRD02_11280 [Aequorivita sp. SDUM287046]|uniref:ATP-binding protein n=1 Tax=Aequorivita aurantiaca TaxID=3053356 RepID=A0ABT8DI10_9FLAO|nr:hypothetical protein [Aequorivita aurantiaca]MDN3724968.1 hypothetical protein [Aequorivita aurantiaca]
MKNREQIKYRIGLKRFLNDLKRKNKKKEERKQEQDNYLRAKEELNGDLSYQNQIEKWLPSNLSYILSNEKAKFDKSISRKKVYENTFKIKVPEIFSLIENGNNSYKFIRKLTINILLDQHKTIEIDYSECKRIELSAQIYLDMILQDLLKFISRRNNNKNTQSKIRSLSGINIHNHDIRKLLFSIGSPAIISKGYIKFPDIITYKLCVHNKEFNKIENAKRKEVDSTEMVDYVIDSLASLNKELTGDSIEDLSIVIGEILINAEEHSTTKYRYSTGFFQKHENGGEDFGVFHLAIMNFGETIYEKFKSPTCTNEDMKKRMADISSRYTKKSLWSKSLDEETLWTLYALQQGITSVSIESSKRGNGSIQFIESFFNLKGTNENADEVSRMAIISGNTNIIFDGSYNIQTKTMGTDTFKVMTFNKTNNIEEKPDSRYVKSVNDYFPGTVISARILISKDDII